MLLPDSLLRLLLWMFTHSVYRIRVEGRDNIPESGGALFVCNHVSFVDALLVQASTDRPLRCIMFKDIYEHPIVKPFAKIARHIPISSQQRPREMIKSLQRSAATRSRTARSSSSSPKARSRASASCCRSDAASSGS